MDVTEDAARGLGIELLRLDTNSALAEAGQLYRRSGWSEIPRFNDDPYPDLFFEKRLERGCRSPCCRVVAEAAGAATP